MLEVDERGRVSLGKLLGGAERVIATQLGAGRVLIEAAVVVRAIVPLIRHDATLTAEIDASLAPDQTFVPRKRRPPAA